MGYRDTMAALKVSKMMLDQLFTRFPPSPFHRHRLVIPFSTIQPNIARTPFPPPLQHENGRTLYASFASGSGATGLSINSG